MKENLERLYRGRMYNLLNFKPRPGVRSHSESTKKQMSEVNKVFDEKKIDTTLWGFVCEGKFYKSMAEASFAYGYKTKDGLK